MTSKQNLLNSKGKQGTKLQSEKKVKLNWEVEGEFQENQKYLLYFSGDSIEYHIIFLKASANNYKCLKHLDNSIGDYPKADNDWEYAMISDIQSKKGLDRIAASAKEAE
jgi:hypothetical protein